MDANEARLLAAERVGALRRLSYDELVARYLDRPEAETVTGESGSVYEVETQAFWENLAERRLRVSIAVDDGGWSGSSPLTDGFVVAPEGTFAGE